MYAVATSHLESYSEFAETCTLSLLMTNDVTQTTEVAAMFERLFWLAKLGQDRITQRDHEEEYGGRRGG